MAPGWGRTRAARCALAVIAAAMTILACDDSPVLPEPPVVPPGTPPVAPPGPPVVIELLGGDFLFPGDTAYYDLTSVYEFSGTRRRSSVSADSFRVADSTVLRVFTVGPFDALYATALRSGETVVRFWYRSASTTRVFRVVDSLPRAPPMRDVSIGIYNACAIKRSDDRPMCWNTMGTPEYRDPRSVGADPAWPQFAELAFAWTTCGLLLNGWVMCGVPVGFIRDSLVRPVQLTTSGYHHCGLRADSTAVCWSASFALGTPITPPGDHRFLAISMGGDLGVCGIRVDRRVLCWAPRDTGARGTPTMVPSLQDAEAVSAESMCAVTTVGDLSCWTATTAASVVAGLPPMAGIRGSCALARDGSAWCRGPFITPILSVTTGSADEWRRVEGAPPFASLRSGVQAHCGITAEGAVWCWGYNSAGQLGDGTTASRLRPRPLMAH